MVSFPGSIPSLARPSSSTAMNATGYEGDVVIDAISDEVEAIATELGTDPAGNAATVKARLEYVERAREHGPVWVSGGYTTTSPRSGVAGSSGAYSASVTYYCLWVCPASVTVDRVAIEVVAGAAAGANARVGIYSADGTTYGPGALLLDAGEVDCSTTGVKELTVSQALVGGAIYWMGLLNETANVEYRGIPATSANAFGAVTGNTQTRPGTTVTQSQTYGSGLPTTAAAWASMTTIDSTGSFMVWMRRT